MDKWKVTGLLAALIMVAGCSGEIELSCDEPRLYQEAVAGPRLEAPEGLDELDSFREMPVPEAAPRPERPEGSPCLDLPPSIRSD